MRDGARVAQVLVAPPYAVYLLGGVDEEEEECERTSGEGIRAAPPPSGAEALFSSIRANSPRTRGE
jgi:hypothetical protein